MLINEKKYNKTKLFYYYKNTTFFLSLLLILDTIRIFYTHLKFKNLH